MPGTVRGDRTPNPFVGNWRGATSFGGQDVETGLHFTEDAGRARPVLPWP